MIEKIKRYNKNKVGELKMSTISFEKEIIMNERQMKKIVKAIKRQERENITCERVDTINKINRGKRLLEQLFLN